MLTGQFSLILLLIIYLVRRVTRCRRRHPGSSSGGGQVVSRSIDARACPAAVSIGPPGPRSFPAADSVLISLSSPSIPAEKARIFARSSTPEYAEVVIVTDLLPRSAARPLRGETPKRGCRKGSRAAPCTRTARIDISAPKPAEALRRFVAVDLRSCPHALMIGGYILLGFKIG